MESLEGKKGQPRLKPPFPAAMGVYGNPTTVNNVESIAVVPGNPAPRRRLVRRHRPAQQHRHQAHCVSGHVNKPATFEEAMGIPFEEMIEKHCGGIRGGWDNLLAVIPGGASVPVRAGREDPPRADGFRRPQGGRLVARHRGGDRHGQVDRHHPRHLAARAFYKHESCGQCTPCREGTGWMMRVMERMVEGRAQKREIDMLFEVTKQIEGHTICALGDAAAWPIQGLIRNFRP